jgi:phosphatidylserine/phosphatidylglycerophosphate/cardiolipin synthase-like enzyme
MPFPNQTSRDELIANLIVLLDNIPEEKINIISKYLETNSNISRTKLKELTRLTGLSYSALNEFINEYIDRHAHVLAMETAVKVRHHILNNTDLCELIWTAPVSFSVSARSTVLVIGEMINKAEHKITVVGYRVEEYASQIVSYLFDAMERGVDVTVILDRAQDQLGLFQKIWGKRKLPKIYTRSRGKTDRMESLHAKLVITDHLNLLVTSANLTYHGLFANIEIGVRIRGKLANTAQSLINSLIRIGELSEVT